MFVSCRLREYSKCIFGLCLLLIPTGNASADLVFTVSAGAGGVDRIVRASNVSGNPANVTLSTLWENPAGASNQTPWGVAVDSISQTAYWTDTTDRRIRSVSLNGGSSQVNFHHQPGAPLSISYAQNRLYFVAGSTTNGIVRSSTDGTNLSTFAAINTANVWTTVDAGNSFLYFTESNADRIARINLSGTPVVETVVAGLSSNNIARGIAVNGDFIYWVDNGDDFLRRSEIGSNTVEDLLNLRSLTNGTASTPNALTTDGQFLYWTEGLTGFRGVYRAALDGTDAVQLISLTNSAESAIGIVAFSTVPEPGSLLAIVAAMSIFGASRFRGKRAS